jgi:hypothetical protein
MEPSEGRNSSKIEIRGEQCQETTERKFSFYCAVY